MLNYLTLLTRPVAVFVVALLVLCAGPWAVAEDAVLLDRWQGHWVGESERFQPGAEVVRFHTEIIVEPIEGVSDALTWTLVYSQGDTKQIRRYRLIVKDPVADAYAIDENNSIVLSMTMLGGSLHGMFDMDGARIVFFYRLHEGEQRSADTLEMELVFYEDAWEMTGGKGGAPEIRSGAAGSVQRVMLSRSAEAGGQEAGIDEGDAGPR